MTEATKAIQDFFDAYAKATASLDLAFLESAYGDPFMFAYPGGVQAVKRDDFLKVVPKRGAFFRAAGLVAAGAYCLWAAGFGLVLWGAQDGTHRFRGLAVESAA